MAISQFEEKEYEFQFSMELMQGRLGTVWSAGQVLEGIVGYDGVADPDIENVVWEVLKVPRPKGVVLAPSHWQGGARPSAEDLSSGLVTLVLQYKRADYLYGARAAQWQLWYSPYYRFRRASRQHHILARLERNLEGLAIVRYAAPAFWKRADLESNAVAGSVIEQSGFVSPETLGPHKVWTYVEPGVAGRANPSGRTGDFESASALRDLLKSTTHAHQRKALVLAEKPGFEIALRLGSIADYRQPRLREEVQAFARELLSAELDLSESALKSIIGLAAFTTLLRNIGASWYLVGKDPLDV